MFESPGKQLKKCWNDPLISHSFSFVMSPFLCQFPSHSLISYLLWLFKSPMKVLVIYANLAILNPSASSFLPQSLLSYLFPIFCSYSWKIGVTSKAPIFSHKVLCQSLCFSSTHSLITRGIEVYSRITIPVQLLITHPMVAFYCAGLTRWLREGGCRDGVVQHVFVA